MYGIQRKNMGICEKERERKREREREREREKGEIHFIPQLP